MLQKIINRVTGPWQEFPKDFKVLMGASFIDRLGGALLFPFFGLYVTDKFGVGMTEVGIIFAIWAITSQAGSVVGGGLTDKFGRKTMVMFGLIVSAISALAMAFVNDLNTFYITVAIAGTLGDIGGPAQQAMVADLRKRLNAVILPGESEILSQTQTELTQYFAGERQEFSIPLDAPGTEFQQSVWQVLREIPYGETRSYKQQARAINNPKAVRAVASANGHNRVTIVIPCHRVIGSDGSLTGYGGGLHRKQWLLDLEQSHL